MDKYIFVLATVLLIVPFLFLFKVTIEKVKEDPAQFPKIFTQFIVWIAIFEFLPILLIIFGFVNKRTVTNISDIYLPVGLILIFTLVAIFFVFLQTRVDIIEEAKAYVQRMMIIAMTLIVPIPLLAMIGLLSLVAS